MRKTWSVTSKGPKWILRSVGGGAEPMGREPPMAREPILPAAGESEYLAEASIVCGLGVVLGISPER